MKKLKLSKLSKNQIDKRGMGKVKGGTEEAGIFCFIHCASCGSSTYRASNRSCVSGASAQ